MVEADFDEFSQLLDGVCGLLSKGAYVPSAVNTALFFRSLQRFELDLVRAALDAHIADPVRGRYPPVPADILHQIEAMAAADGRLGPEEAWALAYQAKDEAATVVWTQEISQAYGLCRAVLLSGDEVAARMTFKEAYLRLLAEARAERRPVRWVPSIGHDGERAMLALNAAVELGRLPGQAKLPMLAPPVQALPDLADLAPPSVKEKLLALRDYLTGRMPRPTAAELQAEADRQATASLKASAKASVEAFEKGGEHVGG